MLVVRVGNHRLNFDSVTDFLAKVVIDVGEAAVTDANRQYWQPKDREEGVGERRNVGKS